MCEGSSLNFSSSHSAFNSYPGRPMKLNTAEAMAACLFITGYQDEARIMLGSFGYGEEFLRLNEDALNAYCSCSSGEEVAMVGKRVGDAVGATVILLLVIVGASLSVAKPSTAFSETFATMLVI